MHSIASARTHFLTVGSLGPGAPGFRHLYLEMEKASPGHSPRRLTVVSSETGGKLLHWSRGCHVSTPDPNIGNKDGLIDMDYSGSHLQMRVRD